MTEKKRKLKSKKGSIQKPFKHVFTKGNRRGLDSTELKQYSSFRSAKVGKYVECGPFSLIPLHQYNAVIDGVERGKTPLHNQWQEFDYTHWLDAEWFMHKQGHNIGVRIGDAGTYFVINNKLVVDVDPRNYEDGVDSLKKLQATCKFHLEDYPFVETGGGGYHIYMLIPATLKGLRESHPDYPGIDFKTKGQVVAAGSVHPNGITYEWGLFSPPLEKISRAPGKLIELLHQERHVSNEETGRHTPEQLAKMLEGLNPADFRVHREWLALMMACHHATAGDGIDEFVEWSISDPYYAHHELKIRRRWDSLHLTGTYKITYKTLYKRLHKKGKGELIPPPTTAEEDFEPVNPEDVEPYL